MNSQVTAQTSSKGKYYKSAVTNNSGLGRKIKLHFRRIALEIMNLLFNHDWLFSFVGVINKRLNIIKSVFLVYPATEDYALAYVYPWRIRRTGIWCPWFGGILWQDGKLTIMFMISAHNGLLTSSENTERLRGIAQRMEKLRQLFCAERKTFAGILAGVLYSKRIIREAPEADLAAAAVVQAVEKIKMIEFLNGETPIVILGGRGFIGRRVVKLLAGHNIYPIDVLDGKGREDWPTHISGQRSIVINITLNNAIAEYLDLLEPGMVVVNEVYPEPAPEVREKLRLTDCPCYHVVGVKALAWPAFPSAYAGAIPCCAAWPSENMEVKILKLL